MEGPTLRTRIPNQQIALRGIRLRSSVAALAERAVVEQTFVNLEPQPIEAIYTFPLPDDAAVCHFEVVTGDRVLTGVVEETEAAIEKYDAAIDRGDAAYLLEQERPDVFTIRVGNIKPKQAATIRLTYVRPLKVVDRQIRLAYPTTVAPRYVTATGSADPLEAQIDGDAVNPPHALHVPYGLNIEIDLDLGGVTSIDCPSHSIRVQAGEDHRRRITFGGGLADMDRDVVLDIRLAKEQRPSVVVVKGDPARGGAGSERDHFLAITFMPEFNLEKLATPAPAETVFVLDCSGSMTGESTAQAIAALELCLRSLGEGDTFNICRFGSHFEMMESAPIRYSEGTLVNALLYLRAGRELGGTELFPPLAAIFNQRPPVSGMRNIVLLTDGQVSNEPEVIQLARQHRGQNRIFAFGIGAAASANLVNGLARATGGAAEFISVNERIDEKVLRAFGRMASPMLSDVEIDWGGADVQTLAEIPPIFDGDAVAVYARTLGSPPKQVTLKCKLAGGGNSGQEAKWTLPVGYAIPDTAGVISTMWARRAIQSFEEVNGVRRASARLREQNRDRDRLIALSKQFNLVCSLTSFIAVEHRSLDERNTGQPAVRRVPVMLAAGWGGVAAGAGGAVLACRMAAPGAVASRGSAKNRTIDKTMDRTIDRLRDSLDKSLDRSIDKSIDICSLHEAPEPPIQKLLSTIISEALQKAAKAIDLEPTAHYVSAVMLIGDERRESDHIPLRMYKPLVEEIARRAGIADATSDKPQAGALSADIDGHRVSLPVQTRRTPLGPVIRIELPPSQHGVFAAIRRKLHHPSVQLREPDPDPLMAVLSRQTAEGAFKLWPPDCFLALAREVRAEMEVLGVGRSVAVINAVTHTMLCLLSMQTTHAARRDLWQRAHAKGVRYVVQELAVTPDEITVRLDRLAQRFPAGATAMPASQPTA